MIQDFIKKVGSDFDEEFKIQDDIWGKKKYGEGTVYQPSRVKHFYSSKLQEAYRLGLERAREEMFDQMVIIFREEKANLDNDSSDGYAHSYAIMKKALEAIDEEIKLNSSK